MINCLLIDDEQPAINVLKKYLQQIEGAHVFATCTSPVEALMIAESEPIDLIFLDIQMPEITGIEFIKALNRKSKIIITSAYPEFALEGYELEVIDYLLKPIPLARFIKAMNKAMAALQERPSLPSYGNSGYDFIMVKGNAKGKLLKVEIDEIDYIEGLGNYVTIHGKDKKIVSMASLRELEEKLPPAKFIRVHKSYIVALTQIAMVNANDLTLKNHPRTEIFIGKIYKSHLMEILRNRTV